MINEMLNQTQRITNGNLFSFMSPARERYFGVTGGPPNILQIILFCVRLTWLAFKRKLTCMLLGGKVNTLLKLQSYFTCQDRFFFYQSAVFSLSTLKSKLILGYKCKKSLKTNIFPI